MPSLVTLIDGTVPVAADFNGNYTALNNAIGSSTAISTWVLGEIPYASATDTLSRLAPGAVGKVLTMTSTVPNWEGGAWVTPGFSAGDFTASGSMTWTVAAGDVGTYSYSLIGKSMTVIFTLITTTVGGTPSNELRLKVPAGKIIQTVNAAAFIRSSDAGAAFVPGFAQAIQGGTYISLFSDLTGASNWSAATDTTAIQGEITFEIQ